MANTFGRRPVVLIALLVLTLSCVWAGLATSFTSLLGARTIMGVGAGAADALCPDVIGEMFFVHQRGRAIVSCLPSFPPFYHNQTLTHMCPGVLYRIPVPWIHSRRSVHWLHPEHWLCMDPLDQYYTLRNMLCRMLRFPARDTVQSCQSHGDQPPRHQRPRFVLIQ